MHPLLHCLTYIPVIFILWNCKMFMRSLRMYSVTTAFQSVWNIWKIFCIAQNFIELDLEEVIANWKQMFCLLFFYFFFSPKVFFSISYALLLLIRNCYFFLVSAFNSHLYSIYVERIFLYIYEGSSLRIKWRFFTENKTLVQFLFTYSHKYTPSSPFSPYSLSSILP